MTISKQHTPHYINIVFTMLLVTFVSFKVLVPAYRFFKTIGKELATAQAEEDTDLAVDKDDILSRGYFNRSSYAFLAGAYPSVTIMPHVGQHPAAFLADHIREINSPPPDRA